MAVVLCPKMIFTNFLSLILYSYFISCLNNNHDEIKITGPGIRPQSVVMPARYFFIYLNNYKSEGHDPSLIKSIEVDIKGTNSFHRECRVWVSVLDRKDGSFIARYKLYETCYSMNISVTYKGEHVRGSPFLIKEPVQPEDCQCPSALEKWIEDNECQASFRQMERDLEAFPTVNFSAVHEQVVDKVDKSGAMSVCNYIILNNEIYRKCYGQHVGFKMFVDAILTSLARKVELPDTEMFVNLGDWPLVERNAETVLPTPMFSWCGSDSTLDIVWPTYDITESSLEMMGRVSLDMISVQGNIERTWDKKESKVFWRGRDSSRERLQLMDIAKKHPDLFNVSITNYFFFRDQEKVYGKSKHVSFFKFFDYKYQLCLDGTVAAYRLPYLLAGDTLVLKQDSQYYEHFYSELKPWVHYVPIKRDLSDLVEKVRWAQDNDEEAKKISLAGQQFARKNLLPQNIFCYHMTLIKEWSKRVVGKVKLRDGMERVLQPEKNKNDCDCSPNLKRHEEL